MTISKRILFVENDEHVLRAVTLRLRLEDYEVIQAKNLDEAKSAIKSEIFHIAVIDIRIENDRGDTDKSGFDLARLLPSYIPFIIHTAHDTRENIRKAFGDIGADDVINKDDPDAPGQLISRLQVLFAEKVKINFALNIHLATSLTMIVAGLDWPEITDAIRPSPDDLEMLFRRLFLEASDIYPSPLISPEAAATLSQSGAILLKVQEKRAHGTPMPVVLKLGSKSEIDTEAHNYQAVRPYLGGNRLARLESQACSRNLGGLVYTLVGADNWEPIHTLNQRLHQLLEDEASKQAIQLINQFFRQTFANLYKDAQRATLYLTKHYTESLHLTVPKLKEALTSFHLGALENSPLKFRELPGEYCNPITWAIDQDRFREFSPVITRICLCHGDLHTRNILVDDKDEFWLVDFARSSISHALRDIAELETDLKFQVLPNFDLPTLLRFERTLVSQTNWSEQLPATGLTPKLICAFEIIMAVRKLAAELINLENDMQEYYQALFWHTLNILRFKSIGEYRKEYALLSASLIAERLRVWPTKPTGYDRELLWNDKFFSDTQGFVWLCICIIILYLPLRFLLKDTLSDLITLLDFAMLLVGISGWFRKDLWQMPRKLVRKIWRLTNEFR